MSFGAVLGLTCALGCEPTLDLGTYRCEPKGELRAPTEDDILPFPWSTSFERQFCDYDPPLGFCYKAPAASFEIVTEPVRSGRFAAAVTVVAAADSDATQTRCVRQGVLPIEAYYGAWYFIPVAAVNEGNWNLFHFRGALADEAVSLWDVSLASDESGALRLALLNFQDTAGVRVDPSAPTVPIGRWFHVQFFWKRSTEPDGEVAVYQDGERLYHLQDIVTDNTDWAAWYVGNFATGLVPPTSTIYVDDVSITETL